MKRFFKASASAAIVLLGLSLAPFGLGALNSASAQDNGSTETAAEERATSFRGVEGAATDSVPGGALLVTAYAIAWVLLFGFLWRLRRLHQRNEAELARLAAKVHGLSGSD